MALQIGQVALGKYRIVNLIGEGTFGRVFLAEEEGSGRRVAIKELRHDLPGVIQEEARERFGREIEIASQLDHPHVVRMCETHRLDDDVFLVMEYMEDGSLWQRLKRERALPIPEALRIAIEICQALDYVHNHPLDLVHRDVTPRNILFAADGTAKLSDFGVAQSPDYTWTRWSGGQHEHPGDPFYRAPEASRSEPLRPSADLYMLGCVLWEMLTGHKYYRHIGEQPSSHGPAVPPQVEQVLGRVLCKDPEERYTSGLELSNALQQALEQWEQACCDRLLLEAEDLLARQDFKLVEGKIEQLARIKPGHPAVAELRSRVEQELALAALYESTHIHLEFARENARKILVQRPDYPDREGVFADLKARRIARRESRKPAKREGSQKKARTRPAETPQSAARSAAWWLLGLSTLLAVPTFGVGLLGVTGAIGMLRRKNWGRRLGLACAILFEALGLIAAVGIVVALCIDWWYDTDALAFWASSTTALVGMSIGIILAYMLNRELVVRGFGEETRQLPVALPVSVPVMLTGIGVPVAIAFLRKRRRARVAMIVFLCVLALALLGGAIVAGFVMVEHDYVDEYSSTNEWGFAIGLIEAVVATVWCGVACGHLASSRVKRWFEADARAASEHIPS